MKIDKNDMWRDDSELIVSRSKYYIVRTGDKCVVSTIGNECVLTVD